MNTKNHSRPRNQIKTTTKKIISATMALSLGFPLISTATLAANQEAARFNFLNAPQQQIVEQYLKGRSRSRQDAELTNSIDQSPVSASMSAAAAAPAPAAAQASPPASPIMAAESGTQDRDREPVQPPPALFSVPRGQQQEEARLELARVSSEFQCDLFSDQSPMSALDQSLNEMVNVFKAEPECRPYVQQVEQVDQNATNLQTIFQTARQTLSSGVTNAQEIVNAQNMALQLLQGARENVTSLIPSLSPECRAKLYTKAHIVKGISDFALNLTPWVLRLASLNPAAQSAAQIVTGATSMIASVTSQLADEQIRSTVNMSLRENRINLAKNVCQYYKISKRFKLLTLTGNEGTEAVDQSLTRYIEQYLRQSDQIPIQTAEELSQFWRLYQSTYTIPNRLKASQFISEVNLFLPIRDLNRLTNGNQCVFLIKNKLRQSETAETRQFQEAMHGIEQLFLRLRQDTEDLHNASSQQKLTQLMTDLRGNLDLIRSQPENEQLPNCRKLAMEFTAEWKKMTDDLIGYYEIGRELLTESLEEYPEVKAHYQNIERFRSHVSALEEEKKLATQNRTQDSVFAKSEINEKMDTLRKKLLNSGNNPIEDWMTYKIRVFDRTYEELLRSLREIEMISLQFAGGPRRPQIGQAGGNIIRKSIIQAYQSSDMGQITNQKLGNNSYLKTQVCANLSHTMNKGNQILDELGSMKLMCQYIENDLNQTTSATLRNNCLGQIRVMNGRSESISPLFLRLASQLNNDYIDAGVSIQSTIREVRGKFQDLDCSL